MEKQFEFYVAGVQHHSLHTILQEVQEGDELLVIPEPTNKYDKNALKIVYESLADKTPVMIGYVPGKLSAQVSALLNVCQAFECKVLEFNPGAKPWNQIKVIIKEYDPDALIEDDDLEDLEA